MKRIHSAFLFGAGFAVVVNGTMLAAGDLPAGGVGLSTVVIMALLLGTAFAKIIKVLSDDPYAEIFPGPVAHAEPEKTDDECSNEPQGLKSLDDYPKVIRDYVLSLPRWSETRINQEFAAAVKRVEARRHELN